MATPTRPFRIVIADDEVQHSLQQALAHACPEAEIWRVRALSDNDDESCPRLVDEQGQLREQTGDHQWKTDYLLGADVLILDLKMSCYVDEWQRVQEPTEFEGAQFLLTMHPKLHVQVVFIYTAYDIDTRAVDPLTQDAELAPPVFKYTKEQTHRLAEVIHEMYDSYTRGLVDISGGGAIEFAACHDLPVLILGETGTGKERVARSIHNRWTLEMMRKGVVPERLRFRAINCAGLARELAWSVLFGHVKGSFTGAGDHRIGAVLYAAGAEPIPADKKAVNLVQDFADRFRENNGPLVNETTPAHGLDIKLKVRLDTRRREVPLGTLFLDEFGDLDPSVQAMLLRYLQEKEVQPLGYEGGVIKKANVRILAATSDPAVAKMVGQELLSRPRSSARATVDLREDIVFRLKGQVIRVPPVDESNAERVLTLMLDSVAYHAWDAAARQYVVERITEISQATRVAAQSGEAPPCIFGHRRELAHLIQLADAYVSSATDRGIRGIGNRVTKNVVERIWRVSEVSLPFEAQQRAEPGYAPKSAFFALSDSSKEQLRIYPDDAKEAIKYVLSRLDGNEDAKLEAPDAMEHSQPESVAAGVYLTWAVVEGPVSGKIKNRWTKRVFSSKSVSQAQNHVRAKACALLGLARSAKALKAESQRWANWCRDREGLKALWARVQEHRDEIARRS